MKFSWMSELLLAVVILVPFAGIQCSAHGEELRHSQAMTAIHNSHRAQVGLSPQSADDNLTNIAQNWANHMAARGSMFHGGGEQIIAYSGGGVSYEQGFRLWLGSAPHRAWLCSSGDRCGFGYAIGRNGCAYYAGAFSGSSGGASYSSSGSRRRLIFRRR